VAGLVAVVAQSRVVAFVLGLRAVTREVASSAAAAKKNQWKVN